MHDVSADEHKDTQQATTERDTRLMRGGCLLVRWFGRGLAALCLFGLLFTWWDTGHWLLEGAAFFVPAYGPFLLLAVLLCFVGHSWKWAGFAGLGVLTLLPLLSAGFAAAPRAPEDMEANLRILQANLYLSNKSTEPILKLVEELKPDVLLFQEQNEWWGQSLAPLELQYPYRTFVPRYREAGLALGIYSKRPLHEVQALAKDEIPAVSAMLQFGERAVRVINVHTASPWSPRRAERHVAEMAALAEHAASQEDLVILAGDLNATPWHKPYQALLRQGGLVPVRRGIVGTWPSFLPWIGVPLDHMLVSPGIQVVDSWVGPDIGSDHRPMITDLRVPARVPVASAPSE